MGNYALIKMRILGLLIEYAQLDASTGDKLVHIIYNRFSQQQNKPLLQSTGRQDSRIARRELLPEGVYSVRTHTEPIQSESPTSGNFMALRLLYDSTKAEGSLETRMTKLGFEPKQIKVIEQLTNRGGLSLISGPTGHGKSTLLKHVMESMVENVPQKSYFSVEDPPEYIIHGVCQIQVNTDSQEVQDDPEARARAYRDAIAGALRSDPDVIMIGEIRYAEAADASIQAALTGHGIWATIHASDAFAVVSRLAGLLRQLGIEHPLDTICNSSVLSGLCYQRLLPVLCPNCKRRYLDLTDEQKRMAISDDVRDRLISVIKDEQWENLYVVGDGCEECRGRGNVSMTVAAETVLLDQELLHLLQEGKTLQARAKWRQKGGISYVEHAILKIGRGLVDPMAAETRLGVPLTHSLNFYEGEDDILGGRI